MGRRRLVRDAFPRDAALVSFVAALILVGVALRFRPAGGPVAPVAGIVGAVLLVQLVVLTLRHQETMAALEEPLRCVVEHARGESIAVEGEGLVALESALEGIADRQRQLREAQASADLLQTRAEQARYELATLVQHLPVATVALSAFGEAMLLNRAAKALLGVTGRDTVGKPVAEVVSEPAVAAALTEALKLPEPGARRDLEVRLGPEGAPRVLAISVVALPDAEGRVGGVAAAIRDVSYEKEVEKVKSDFVSGVSHELKTPLASIKAFAEILSDGEVAGTGEIRRICTCIETEVDRLTRLINNLLNLSKIEAGIIRLTRTTFPARELLERVTQVLEPHASKRRQTLRTELSEYLPSLTADRDMVEQMVINLVSNAVKYTPEGGSVWLRGKVAGRSLLVEVEDNGPGIAPEHQERVFDKFYRVPGERAAGTGLGLPLARRLARMHGGDIALSSEPGRGACFRLTLPVGSTPHDQPTQEALECARPS